MLVASGFCGLGWAQDADMPVPDQGEPAVAETTTVSDQATVSATIFPAFAQVAPEAEQIGGPVPTYRKKDNLYWEISSGQLNVDYIMVMSVARGIGTSDLYGGQSLDYGNDMIWQFRKVDDRIQLVRRNNRYRANKGPDAEALRVAFTDSIVFSFPIIARGPQGGDVIDVTSLFMSDTLAMISSRALSGFSFARDRSSWEKVKAFKDNLELEVAATYAGRVGDTDTIVDTRGVGVNIHYSISRLKDSGYQPRLADERVGYFMTAYCDVSKLSTDDNFVRYINRWNLQKLEPNAEKSLPKKPIVFWLDKATPYQYRKTVRDGILEWNRAFEKAGFYNAVEVRQQEDNDDWDPEDINYNTIRWSVTQTGFSIGPSRINPSTGEILDADVVLTVGFLTSWARQFELYTSDQLVDKFGSVDRESALKALEQKPESDFYNRPFESDTELYYSQQFGLAETFFDIMSVGALALDGEQQAQEAAPQVDEAKKAEDEAAAKAKAEEEAKQAAEAEASAKAKEEARQAEEQALRETAQKAADAAANAQQVADEAKRVAEEAAKSGDAKIDELNKKAQEAKDAADVALRVANETAKKFDEWRAAFDKAREAEEVKKLEEAEAKAKADAEAKAKAEEEKKNKDAAQAKEANKKRLEEEKKKLFEQGLRQLVTHEVGHTLGLRHSFKQSALHSLDEINDASKWQDYGFVGSIMEYSPVNIMPKGSKQGDYFSYRLGAYDEWVIEYGYRVFPGKTTETELADLKAIAAKQSKPEYNYSTDEDCYGSTINPYVNIFDLGSSPLEYAKVRARLVDQLMPGLNDQIVKDGDSYRRLQTRFNMLNSWKGNGMVFAANYIGGMKVNRDFKGDENARKPFEVVPAQEQRDAMAFLAESMFSVDSYKIPNDLFNYLAPNRWRHWGSSVPDRYDADVLASILSWQRSILSQLLSNLTLSHLADAELRVPAGEDVFTSAEMLDTLSGAIFKEITDASSALKEKKEGTTIVVSAQRRNLQRDYLDRLISFATSTSTAAGVADVSALSRLQLRKLQADIDGVLNAEAAPTFNNAYSRGEDKYARAHLESMREKIKQTLDAVKTL